MPTQTPSENISDILTPEGIAKLKVGQILIFSYEGSRNELKITKLNKKKGQAWARPVTTYDPEEIEVLNKDFAQPFNNYRENLK